MQYKFVTGPLSAAPLGCAVRLVFKDDSKRSQLGADVVSAVVVTLDSRLTSSLDAFLNICVVDFRGLHPRTRVLSKQTQQGSTFPNYLLLGSEIIGKPRVKVSIGCTNSIPEHGDRLRRVQ